MQDRGRECRCTGESSFFFPARVILDSAIPAISANSMGRFQTRSNAYIFPSPSRSSPLHRQTKPAKSKPEIDRSSSKSSQSPRTLIRSRSTPSSPRRSFKHVQGHADGPLARLAAPRGPALALPGGGAACGTLQEDDGAGAGGARGGARAGRRRSRGREVRGASDAAEPPGVPGAAPGRRGGVRLSLRRVGPRRAPLRRGPAPRRPPPRLLLGLRLRLRILVPARGGLSLAAAVAGRHGSEARLVIDGSIIVWGPGGACLSVQHKKSSDLQIRASNSSERAQQHVRARAAVPSMAAWH